VANGGTRTRLAAVAAAAFCLLTLTSGARADQTGLAARASLQAQRLRVGFQLLRQAAGPLSALVDVHEPSAVTASIGAGMLVLARLLRRTPRA